MTVILDRDSRVMIQGITGSAGRIFAEKFLQDNTRIVAGASPNRKVASVSGVPVYDSVEDCVANFGANTSLVVVPPEFAKDAIMEAVEARIGTIIVYVEGIPVQDTCQILEYADLKKSIVLGPNAAGIVSPGICNVSDISNNFVSAGGIGVVSKSGSLSYELLMALKFLNLGESTVCCIGGDPVIGISFEDVLLKFKEDPGTRAIVLLGEVGGTQEIEAARTISSIGKPVFAFVNGHSVPRNKRIGHAGSIATKEDESAKAKTDTLRDAGAITADNLPGLIREIENWKSEIES